LLEAVGKKCIWIQQEVQYMLAIYFAYYNFCRSHKTLDNATPAMAANLTKAIWSLKDLLEITKDVSAPK